MHKKTSAPLAPWPQHHYLSKAGGGGGGGGLGGVVYKDWARPPPPTPWHGHRQGQGHTKGRTCTIWGFRAGQPSLFHERWLLLHKIHFRAKTGPLASGCKPSADPNSDTGLKCSPTGADGWEPLLVSSKMTVETVRVVEAIFRIHRLAASHLDPNFVLHEKRAPHAQVPPEVVGILG